MNHDNKKIEFNEIHYYRIPWPEEVLKELDNKTAKMSVTLSYFVEPNLNEATLLNTYSYPNASLRFAVAKSGEPDTSFRGRINKLDYDKNETFDATDTKWKLPVDYKNGFFYKNIWEGPAIDLADMNRIAVHPVTGWWKTSKHLERFDDIMRYSLIISIETEEVGVDMYNEVKTLIDIENKVVVEANV